MKNLKRVIAAILSASAMMTGMMTSVYAQTDISVVLESLKTAVPEIVRFDDHEPIQKNNTTLVPVRDIAEAAGMSVEWNQQRQTATITLDADAGSPEPVKQYAAQLMSKVSGYGLELTAQNISVSMKLDDANAVLRYNFADTEGDIVSLGKVVEMDSAATLVDDGSLMIPVRDTMKLFGFNVIWNQSTMSVKISVPEYANAPTGMKIMAEESDEEPAAAETVSYEVESEDAPVNNDPQLGAYIGRFKITHYCPCSRCNGGYGAYTAWAGAINPGTTIAVDSSVIPKLSWVYVDGYGLRRAEDCGGGIKGYHIDMAVPTHAIAMSMGVVYKDVYFAN